MLHRCRSIVIIQWADIAGTDDSLTTVQQTESGLLTIAPFHFDHSAR